MVVLIPLTHEWRDRLLARAPKGSHAAAALNTAVDVTRYVFRPYIELSVACDEDTAELILRLAKAHCPEAVEEIEKALRLFRKMQ